MKYVYVSPVGKFEIVKIDEQTWALMFEEQAFGHYPTPDLAADDVYCQVTGVLEFDSLENVFPPDGLSEWKRID